MKLGIMGGTFDPIHIGHLILGEAAWQELALDEVCFLPNGRPPHKKNRKGADNAQRLHMTELAVRGNPHFSVSDREMRRSGYSYTYQTLEEMRAEDPGRELFFIIGEDSLRDFETWREPARISAACTLVVACRHAGSGTLAERILRAEQIFGARIIALHTPHLDISSSSLREIAGRGGSLRYYVPDTVCAYIEEQGLYCPQPGDADLNS